MPNILLIFWNINKELAAGTYEIPFVINAYHKKKF